MVQMNNAASAARKFAEKLAARIATITASITAVTSSFDLLATTVLLAVGVAADAVVEALGKRKGQ